MLKINFGCGWEQKLSGWINVDLNPAAAPDVRADLSKVLPFPTASADFIYTESFLEVLAIGQGKHFLRECRRILKPTGVMRVLTADLQKLARTYLQEPGWLVETWGITVGVPLATGSPAGRRRVRVSRGRRAVPAERAPGTARPKYPPA